MAASYKKKKNELEKTIKPAIQKEIEKVMSEARNQGILIGWNAFALRAIENIKNMSSINDIKSYFQSEADKTKEKLGLSFGTLEYVENKNVE